MFKGLTKIRTSSFSDFFISLGYLIKSEAIFNTNGGEYLDWDRLDVHKMLASKIVNSNEEIVFLEFGVLRGQTFLIWVEQNTNPNSRFVGFDTFTGLPEDWGSIKKGSFSAFGKIPDIKDMRVDFQIGLIQDTLPNFAKNLSKGKRKIIHIDVDLYNATLITLIHLNPFLGKGDIIIFDDFFSITKSSHEPKGFLDYLKLYKTDYKSLINCRNGHYVIEIA